MNVMFVKVIRYDLMSARIILYIVDLDAAHLAVIDNN